MVQSIKYMYMYFVSPYRLKQLRLLLRVFQEVAGEMRRKKRRKVNVSLISVQGQRLFAQIHPQTVIRMGSWLWMLAIFTCLWWLTIRERKEGHLSVAGYVKLCKGMLLVLMQV